jgi:hypothetical protein
MAQNSLKLTTEKIIANIKDNGRNFPIFSEKSLPINGGYGTSHMSRPKYEPSQLLRGLKKPDTSLSAQTEATLNLKSIGAMAKKTPSSQNSYGNNHVKLIRPPSHAFHSHDSNSLTSQINLSKAEPKDSHSLLYRKKRQSFESNQTTAKGRDSAKVTKNSEYNPDKSTSQISNIEPDASNTMTTLFSYRLGNTGMLDRRILYAQDSQNSINGRKVSGGSFVTVSKQINGLN